MKRYWLGVELDGEAKRVFNERPQAVKGTWDCVEVVPVAEVVAAQERARMTPAQQLEVALDRFFCEGGTYEELEEVAKPLAEWWADERRAMNEGRGTMR